MRIVSGASGHALLHALVTHASQPSSSQFGAELAAFGFPWPAGLPGPLTLWLQGWVADVGPFGYVASNGISGTQP
ncbi:MAG: hypothetical protein H6825_02545 [Planctomycetes bacterium]|nr:hypothetical protein [Planctomycetota bacterium]